MNFYNNYDTSTLLCLVLPVVITSTAVVLVIGDAGEKSGNNSRTLLFESRSYRVRQAQLAQKLAQNLAPIFGAKSTFDPCANFEYPGPSMEYIRVRQWNLQ